MVYLVLELLEAGETPEQIIKSYYRKLTKKHIQAALHYAAGFPNGTVGYAMVLVWGMALGWLRRRTRGLLAAYAVHVGADLVIALYLWSLAARSLV